MNGIDCKFFVSNQRGMSLMEILIVITLIGFVGTFVTGQIFDRLSEGKISTAKIQIGKLGERLKEFRRHCGYYPATEQGLDALVTKPEGGRECKRYAPNGYIDGKVPQDPWDGDYVYESDGKTYKIISYGEDGAEGGEGADADISSEDL